MKLSKLNAVAVMAAFAAAATTFAASASSISGNIEAGKTKAATCLACHGEGGAKPIAPEYPILAGQHPDYILAALQQYKSGKRKNASMNGFAAALKTQDMKDLAVYFASQPSPLRSKY
jgi:cytochrome c553